MMLKHPFVSYFHSPAEFQYALLLEADPGVSCYVPQPYKLKVVGRRTAYIPDIYYETVDGRRVVAELKPAGKFDVMLTAKLVDFFGDNGIEFIEITNQSVDKETMLARNWEFIIPQLVRAKQVRTAALEAELTDDVRCGKITKLEHVIDGGNRARSYEAEIALYRLLHAGVIDAPLDHKPINGQTQISLCA